MFPVSTVQKIKKMCLWRGSRVTWSRKEYLTVQPLEISRTELISVTIRSSTHFANSTNQDFLQLTHSASFALIKIHITDYGDVEKL